MLYDYCMDSSAFMLVYIRTSDWDWVMCETDKEDISEPVRRVLEVRDCSLKVMIP